MRATQLRLRPVDRENDGDVFGVDLFYVLTHTIDHEVWVEVSNPIIGQDGKVQGWRERIIIGKLDFDGEPGSRATPAAPTGPTPDVEIELPRKRDMTA